jgi:hypothetical protein
MSKEIKDSLKNWCIEQSVIKVYASNKGWLDSIRLFSIQIIKLEKGKNAPCELIKILRAIMKD